MRYKRESYTARKFLKLSIFCDTPIPELMSTIRNECATLCKKTPSPSYLRVCAINDLFQLDWEPLLQASAERSTRKPADVAAVGMAALLILKKPSPTLILYHPLLPSCQLLLIRR